MNMNNYGGRDKYRLISLILISVFILSAAFSLALAAGTETGKIVNCESFVNVRSGPGSSYAMLGTAAKGSVYTVTGRSGSWYQINYNGKAGYVYQGYISITSQTALQENAGAGLVGKIVNCSSAVNVRSGPGTGYTKVGTAPKGAVYPVTGKTGSWYKIDFNGKTAYVNESYLSVSSLPSPSPSPSPISPEPTAAPSPAPSISPAPPQTPAPSPVQISRMGKIVNCVSSVNVRSGPGTSYPKAGTAPKGAVYPVTGKTGSWYRIDFIGKTAYVHESFLSVSETPYPSPTPSPAPETSPAALEPTAAPVTSPAETPLPADSPLPESYSGSDKILMGYYASWAAYSGFTPLSIHAEDLTHISYAFANISSDLKVTMGDPAADPVNFAKLRELKKVNPHIRTLISVGGWTWSDKFSDAALTEESRAGFAQSAVRFIVENGFDGIDIDWEYPVGGGMAANTVRPEDKTNFTKLMARLREKLDEQGDLDGTHYLLSFAGAAGTFFAENTELPELAKYSDFALIMTYDMHGAWPNSFTDLNSPLFSPSEYSPQYKWSCGDAVRLWESKGFPKDKILMGVPFYGVRFNGVQNGSNGLYGSFTSGSSIPYDKIRSGFLGSSGYQRYLHEDARVPWLFNGSTFISYDDEQSVREKASFIAESGIRGAGVWELSQNKDGTLLKALDSFR
jgi:chitinase